MGNNIRMVQITSTSEGAEGDVSLYGLDDGGRVWMYVNAMKPSKVEQVKRGADGKPLYNGQLAVKEFVYRPGWTEGWQPLMMVASKAVVLAEDPKRAEIL